MKVKQEPTFSPITITLEAEKEAVNLMHFMGCFYDYNLRQIKNICLAHTHSFDADECSTIISNIFNKLSEILFKGELLDEAIGEVANPSFCCVKLDEQE